MSVRTLLFQPATLAFSVLCALATGGCGDDIVFVDREPFNPPPDAASGFLGYFDASTKQTTCAESMRNTPTSCAIFWRGSTRPVL